MPGTRVRGLLRMCRWAKSCKAPIIPSYPCRRQFEKTKMSTLSNEQVQTFYEQGYLLVEAVLSEQDLTPIIQEFDNAVDEKARLLFAQGKITSLHEGADFEH